MAPQLNPGDKVVAVATFSAGKWTGVTIVEYVVAVNKSGKLIYKKDSVIEESFRKATIHARAKEYAAAHGMPYVPYARHGLAVEDSQLG